MWSVTVNYNGAEGDYPQLVSPSSSHEELKNWAWESIRNGEISGMTVGSGTLSDHKVESISTRKLFLIRPKVEFGTI